MAHIQVDNASLTADTGENLLRVCLANDIYIPNLCFLDGMDHPPASCRLCFVELDNMASPVAACKQVVRDGIKVRTDTANVRRLQKSALRLLLSAHAIDCGNCPANRNCALQDMAKFLGIALKQDLFDQFLKSVDVDRSHPCLDYHPNRCVLCGRCIAICNQSTDGSCLTFAWRGTDTVIACYKNDPIADPNCSDCRQCEEVCPVGALVMRPPKHQ